jgi:hypothetical protein
MQSLKKLFIAVLTLLTVVLYLPRITFAQQVHLYAKAGITEHAPKSRTTPEKDIPIIKKKKTSGWTWLILVALLGGVAAAGGGGGGDGGSPAPTTGDVTVGW